MGVVAFASILFVWWHPLARLVLVALLINLGTGMLLLSTINEPQPFIALLHIVVWSPLLVYLFRAYWVKKTISTKERLWRPDVVLMDLIMPTADHGIDGLAAIQQIIHCWPTARILVLTSFAIDDKIATAMQVGASGYLFKDSPPHALVTAIRQPVM